jgi:hypothetical protein
MTIRDDPEIPKIKPQIQKFNIFYAKSRPIFVSGSLFNEHRMRRKCVSMVI